MPTCPLIQGSELKQVKCLIMTPVALKMLLIDLLIDLITFIAHTSILSNAHGAYLINLRRQPPIWREGGFLVDHSGEMVVKAAIGDCSVCSPLTNLKVQLCRV
jgi:hypothetical protein